VEQREGLAVYVVEAYVFASLCHNCFYKQI
jgi:hypothetical protein